MPLLEFGGDTDDDFGAFLINDSYCHAKNITIDDLDVVVDYGFKKHITLEFALMEWKASHFSRQSARKIAIMSLQELRH